LAQGYPPEDAAIAGTVIHGLAGDLAADDKGQQAMIASDIIEHIGNGFNKIENHEKTDLL
jgi:NAD(P)H-hydrate epimerase